MKPMKLQKNSLSEFGQSDPYRIQPSCQGRKISSPLSAHSKARHVTAIIPKQLNNNQYLIYSSTDLLIRTAGAIVLAKHPLKYSGALNRVLNRRLQSSLECSTTLLTFCTLHDTAATSQLQTSDRRCLHRFHFSRWIRL
jgi:hypothetical protein